MLYRAVTTAAIAAVLASAALLPAPANAAGAFANLPGTWSGSGQMRLEGGRSENLRCKAYYTDREGGNGLGIALRCASSSSSVDLRATLMASGNRLSGDWEERQFNIAGRASGSANGNSLSFSINGGGLTGAMSVTTNGSRQTVSITTENVALKGIQISLSRD